MVGREFLANVVRGTAIRMLRACAVALGALRLAADREIADRLIERLYLHFALERQMVKALGLGEDAIDQRLRHAVIGDEIEADALARRTQCSSGALERARLAGEIGAEIDHRNA